jgi:hypothetical protein
MRALIARDLADAAVAGLSVDRRFATAYNAALLAMNMAIACAGYRVTAKIGHHRISFDSSKLALGAGAAKYADYFWTINSLQCCCRLLMPGVRRGED